MNMYLCFVPKLSTLGWCKCIRALSGSGGPGGFQGVCRHQKYQFQSWNGLFWLRTTSYTNFQLSAKNKCHKVLKCYECYESDKCSTSHFTLLVATILKSDCAMHVIWEYILASGSKVGWYGACVLSGSGDVLHSPWAIGCRCPDRLIPAPHHTALHVVDTQSTKQVVRTHRKTHYLNSPGWNSICSVLGRSIDPTLLALSGALSRRSNRDNHRSHSVHL